MGHAKIGPMATSGALRDPLQGSPPHTKYPSTGDGHTQGPMACAPVEATPGPVSTTLRLSMGHAQFGPVATSGSPGPIPGSPTPHDIPLQGGRSNTGPHGLCNPWTKWGNTYPYPHWNTPTHGGISSPFTQQGGITPWPPGHPHGSMGAPGIWPPMERVTYPSPWMPWPMETCPSQVTIPPPSATSLHTSYPPHPQNTAL